MLSIPDMALLGVAALMFFGPDQLPRVARKAGSVMREIQNTSQSFIREMERAADVHDVPAPSAPTPPSAGYAAEPEAADPYPYTPHTPHATPVADPYADAPPPSVSHGVDPYAEVASVEPPVGEKLADPRPALGWAAVSAAAEPAPQADHPTHV